MTPSLRLAVLAGLVATTPVTVPAQDADPPPTLPAAPAADVPAADPRPAADVQQQAQPAPPDQALQDAEKARTEARIQEEVEARLAKIRAQEQTLRRRARLLPHYEYLEDSHVDYYFPRANPDGDHTLIFEAEAATHLFLVNQWDKVEHVTSPGAMASVVSWDVSFLLHLRMMHEFSAPVRPPSYKPAIHLQWFGLWKGSPRTVHELETEGALVHHSNGQQACPFVNDQSLVNPTGDQCVDPGTIAGSLRSHVNFRSGDFSTSYGSLGMHYALITLGADRYMQTRHSLGIVYQQNFVAHRDGWLGEFPGAIPADQAWMYGIHRLKVEAQARYHVGPPWTDLAGVLSLSASEELMWNVRPGIPSTRTIAEVSYTLDGFHGLGVFARGSSGQDDLNILYAAGRTNRLQVGLIWNTSPALRYLFGEGKIPGA